jgi:hypothetical protein
MVAVDHTTVAADVVVDMKEQLLLRPNESK